MPRPTRRTFLRTTTLASVGVATAWPLSRPGPAVAGPAVEVTTVFASVSEGYHTFRIPAVVRAADGTVLAFAEGRVDSSADSGDIDLVLRRSTDGGRTWGPLQVVGDNGPNTFGNPAPVVDPASGDVVLLSTHNDGTVTAAQIRRGEVRPEHGRRIHVQRSSDHGVTWSDPLEITDDVKLPEWRWYATGPVHAIALEHGPHAGRLVVPANHSTSPEPGSPDTGNEPKYFGGHVLYSDDGGYTWRIGGVDTPLTGDVNPNETTATELSDGTVYFNTRNQNGTNPHNRAGAISTDGGETFEAPYAPVSDVVAPVIQGSVLKLSGAADPRRRVVLSVAGHHFARENLTLSSSFDDAASWHHGVVVHDGPAGYSDVVELGERKGAALGVLFESGGRLDEIVPPGLPYHQRISFARVPLARLDVPDPPPRITPDRSGLRNHGTVGGRPQGVGGRFGRALELAGDYVELPLTDALALGENEFTAAAWFRTGERTRVQSLLWAHSHADGAAKWRIQVEPAQNRIHALVDTVSAASTLAVPGDFADDRWHHVALVRRDHALDLYVDGDRAASAAAVPGSVSAAARTGIRIGARVDGVNDPLVGAVEEVWIVGRALDDGQVRTLVERNTAPGAVVHLPVDRIRRGSSGRG
ncbi:sialidase family protein [Jiangella alkaliphila]|uniref:exo-alpha-sialidase n=1 Tax=Jiangella alkaliphila TaxID=419479 RepID=A0A1H2K6M9_9ACTN|nr:sialidase family protein [Jiangella alkaliphila]SDU64223.1 sialidase-1 [Jiangella alkaliphila]